MTDRPAISPEFEAQAAEYVLGLLSEDERMAFEAQLRAEPALGAEVRRWEGYFASMAEIDVEEVAPPARILPAVRAELFGADSVPQPGLLDRIAFWRGLSVATTALAALAMGFAVLPNFQRADPGEQPEIAPTGIPAGTLLMTHLIPTEGSSLGLAVTREPSGVLQVRRVAGSLADGRSQELWVIAGDSAPVSLGVLGEDALTTLTPDADAAQLFGAGAALAITDEPLGGSPTGAPTGEILALGTLVAL